MRLLDVYRGGFTPREALVYIDHLPPTSCYAEATAQDDEVAEVMAEQDASDESASPRIRDFDLTNQLLMRLVESVQENTAAVVVAAGGKAPPLQPMPRPETAMERIRRRREQESFDSLLEDIEAAQARWAARRSVDGGALAD